METSSLANHANQQSLHNYLLSARSSAMSSKLGSKSVKRASSVAKKKGVLTPETSNTPTASSSSIGQQQEGKPLPGASIDEVLLGEDILALRVREEDLSKLHPPRPPFGTRPERTRRVVVRRTHPLTSEESPRPKHKGVTVLHPLPHGTAVSTTKTLGSPQPGPRFDCSGTFLPHSVLGPTENFAHQLKSRGMVGSTSVFTQPPPVVLPELEKTPPTEGMSYAKTIVPREAHALEYWKRSMEDRKLQQEHIASKLQSSPDRLTMNQGDSFHAVQEERMLIDRAIPSVDYGKGYRVGSEFWSQAVRIGNETTGISTTLTSTEKGLPPELEFVGVPATIRREKGVDFGVERNAPLHYTWKQSGYLSTRRLQLGSTLTDTEPFRPEMLDLQVVGHAPFLAPPTPRRRADSLDSLGESSSDEGEGESVSSVLSLQPDVVPPPIIGPALQVGGQLLQWQEGGGRRREGGEAVNMRVGFEAGVGEMATSHLLMENCGTAAVYFSWQPLPRPNPLGTIQAGETQRFYFDTRGGVLLPGQKLSFPFVFQSPGVGIFSELWCLQTGPVLSRGRPIRITLRGVAFQEDCHAHRREEIERMLRHRMAVAAAERLVNRLVDSVRTPPHSPPPLQTTTMEEDVFLAKNPGVFYHHGVVQQLKMVYNELLRPQALAEEIAPEPSSTTVTAKTEKAGGKKEKAEEKGGKKDRASRERKLSAEAKKGKQVVKEEPSKETIPEMEELQVPAEEPPAQAPEWDLSIDSLQEVILGIEEDGLREEKLGRLSSLVGALSFPPPHHTRKRHYHIGYELLCGVVDRVSAASSRLCQTLGLPLREFAPTTSGKPAEEEQTPSIPSSPAHPGKKDKDKKGGKEAKKTDAKQKTGKEKERAPSSKGKPLSTKKSKTILSPKDMEEVEVLPEQVCAVVEVDPVTEKKYRENLYTAVYEILGSAMEEMASLFEELKVNQ